LTPSGKYSTILIPDIAATAKKTLFAHLPIEVEEVENATIHQELEAFIQELQVEGIDG
jgi:hypothetical protein